MIEIIRIPTERPNVYLQDMAKEEDDVAWQLALRTEPHPLLPNEMEAPDYMDFIARRQLATRANVRRLGIWDENNIVGFVSVTILDAEQKIAEVGWKVAPKHQRQGYATIGARTISRYASRELGLRTLFAQIYESNLTSQRVAERAGYASIAHRAGLVVFKYFGYDGNILSEVASA